MKRRTPAPPEPQQLDHPLPSVAEVLTPTHGGGHVSVPVRAPGSELTFPPQLQ